MYKVSISDRYSGETIMIEILFALTLTVCNYSGSCLSQDIDLYHTVDECENALVLYSELPKDGIWKSVEYICRIPGAKAT